MDSNVRAGSSPAFCTDESKPNQFDLAFLFSVSKSSLFRLRKTENTSTLSMDLFFQDHAVRLHEDNSRFYSSTLQHAEPWT